MSTPLYAEEENAPVPQNLFDDFTAGKAPRPQEDWERMLAFGTPADSKLRAYRIATERGLDDKEFGALTELWERESNWNYQAANPKSTAYGIPQAMRSLHAETNTDEWANDPDAQIQWGLNYILGRYGSVAKALEHHNRKGWY